MLCSVPLSLTCVINYSCQTVRLSVDEAFRRPVSGSAVHVITKRQLEADHVSGESIDQDRSVCVR